MTTIEMTSGMGYVVDEDIPEIIEKMRQVPTPFAICLNRGSEEHWFVLAHITHMYVATPYEWKKAPIG